MNTQHNVGAYITANDEALDGVGDGDVAHIEIGRPFVGSNRVHHSDDKAIGGTSYNATADIQQ